MKTKFNKLIELAKQWRDLSYSRYGRRNMSFGDSFTDLYVSCYFADNNDYFSVSFNIKSYGFSWDTICVQFHSTPKIDGITIRSIDVIGIAIQRYTIYLEKVKSDFRTIDKENLKKEKHERIKAIKRELSELEQGGQNEHSTAKNS